MNLNGRLSFTGNVSGSMGAQLVADVEANPSGAPSQTLVSIRVGDVIYSIPSGGGGGGTSDYNALNNKPKVNNIVLSGDLTLADLGIQPAISFPGDGSKYLDGNGSFSTPDTGGLNYSTSEQDTGLKWIDGSTVYQITFSGALSGNAGTIDISALNVKQGWVCDGFYDIGVTELSLNEYIGPSSGTYTHVNSGLIPAYIDLRCTVASNANYVITMKYIKN